MITDGNLSLVDDGVDFVVRVDREKLDRYCAFRRIDVRSFIYVE